jgi:hypothetical protein
MVMWSEFRELEPELAEQGAALLYHFGVGLGYLSTVRPDGGPRVHPMCPILAPDGLFAFIVPSPKQADLRRDGRFALHSFALEENEDAFFVAGRAGEVSDPAIRTELSRQFVEERSEFSVPPPIDADVLFELRIDRALLTRTSGHGDPNPDHLIWPRRADRAR